MIWMYPIARTPLLVSLRRSRYFREIWADSSSFIARAVHLIQDGAWDGINIDFETNQATADDARKFASFLRKLADAVHAVGARVSVDTNWGPYLNPGTLAEGNSVDTFCDMQTCKAATN